MLAIAATAGAAGNITTLTGLLVAQDPLPEVFAVVLPQEFVNTYRASIVWQPVVLVIAGVVVNPTPSILYCIVNPATVVTDGKLNEEAHVLAVADKIGTAGNITTLTKLPAEQVVLPKSFAAVLPHAVVSTYRACTV